MRNHGKAETILVTGGAGFIGSAVIRHLIGTTEAVVVNVDKLTYAANPLALEAAAGDPRYRFVKADICDAAAIAALFAEHRPDKVMHLAAESHVDRSIDGPAEFVRTNVVGTQVLLDAALGYWRGMPEARAHAFRFHHVSTDEVFGSLTPRGRRFTEKTPYAPRSPYSASKAAADHLVRAWHHTFGLPVVLSNCSNNYGPWQFPEKLIPLVIAKALQGAPIPVYGKGDNVRDWLFVDDHAAGLLAVLEQGAIGESYNLGGDAERRNIDVVTAICRLLDVAAPAGQPYERLISFVADRPGHDLRYAIDSAKIQRDLGWTPRVDFEAGLEATVRWYLAHRPWWQEIIASSDAGQRLGRG